jgi:hypothetical protein
MPRSCWTCTRLIFGWQASTILHRSGIDALKMAIWHHKNQGADLHELVHHPDRGVQHRAIRYSQRLAEAGAPCWEWLVAQDRDYREQVLPPTVRARVSVEAGVFMRWREFVGDAGRIGGLDQDEALGGGGQGEVRRRRSDAATSSALLTVQRSVRVS